ncbi:MAG TPA: GTP-binding protein, partial [Rhodanobacter sp.]|nr:GTP-binding protein [Rhodanobacter sp.]
MPIAETASKGLLRFITCGSVDDGKSTLLGRLLYDAGMLADDQIAALVRDSARLHADAGAALDFSLLTDGLDAEREQGITIDVAYRYFHTARRSFIVADCPGHEIPERDRCSRTVFRDPAAFQLFDDGGNHSPFPART